MPSSVATLLPLVCLLIGFAIPVLLFLLVARRARRQLTTTDAYRAVSRRLGLAVDTRGLSLQGYLEERRLWVGTLLVGHGETRSTSCEAYLGFRFPIGLGLHGAPAKRRPGRSREVAHPALGPRFTLETEDTATREALLSSGALEPLQRLLDDWPRVFLSDQAIRVCLDRPESTEHRLSALVSRLRELAEAIEAARIQLGAQPGAPDWTELAEALGLTLEASIPMMQGELDGLSVQVMYVPKAGAWLYLRVPEHTDLGLHVVPQTGPDGYWSVGQDITFGEQAFDNVFVIKGWDPEHVQRLLTPDVRRDLIELLATGSVTLDDHRLTLRGVSVKHETLQQTLEIAVRVVRSILWTS